MAVFSFARRKYISVWYGLGVILLKPRADKSQIQGAFTLEQFVPFLNGPEGLLNVISSSFFFFFSCKCKTKDGANQWSQVHSLKFVYVVKRMADRHGVSNLFVLANQSAIGWMRSELTIVPLWGEMPCCCSLRKSISPTSATARGHEWQGEAKKTSRTLISEAAAWHHCRHQRNQAEGVDLVDPIIPIKPSGGCHRSFSQQDQVNVHWIDQKYAYYYWPSIVSEPLTLLQQNAHLFQILLWAV